MDMNTEHAGKVAQVLAGKSKIPCTIVGSWPTNGTLANDYTRVHLLRAYGAHHAGDTIDIGSQYVERLEA